jgi:hypothetical protein
LQCIDVSHIFRLGYRYITGGVPVLRPGQVAVLETDWTRSSLAVAALLGSRWTHVVVGVGDGMVLSTYPMKNAELVAEAEVLNGRNWVVMDLPDPGVGWRLHVAAAARRLVGTEYWWSPCSRVTAMAFINAGVRLFPDSEPEFRTKLGLLTPNDFLIHTRLARVATTGETGSK